MTIDAGRRLRRGGLFASDSKAHPNGHADGKFRWCQEKLSPRDMARLALDTCQWRIARRRSSHRVVINVSYIEGASAATAIRLQSSCRQYFSLVVFRECPLSTHSGVSVASDFDRVSEIYPAKAKIVAVGPLGSNRICQRL